MTIRLKHHGSYPLEGEAYFCSGSRETEALAAREDRFGRLFPELPPSFQPRTRLDETGAAGGPMSGDKADTKTVDVGQVFFGQFVDHDITFDVSSSFTSAADPLTIGNARTPALDLDCVYGAGPEADPFFYVQGQTPDAGVKLLTGADEGSSDELAKDDVLRVTLAGGRGRALIGDPRNDENRVISQMQLGFIRFHNLIVDRVRVEAESHGEPVPEGPELFEEARELTQWHYQYAVLHDFLPTMCGQAVVDRVLQHGRAFYCHRPFIPVEFSVAAFRFGHSMIPLTVNIRPGGKRLDLFGDDLGRGFTAPTKKKAIVDWHEMFRTGANRTVQRAEQLDTRLADVLLDLPGDIASNPSSLATRNFLRSNIFGLPAGEVIAKHMAQTLGDEFEAAARIPEVSLKAQEVLGVATGIPLWLYILAEAEVVGRETKPGVFNKGEGLGPVGARIVAEVIVGLLEMDDASLLGSNRNFVPFDGLDTVGNILAATQA